MKILPKEHFWTLDGFMKDVRSCYPVSRYEMYINMIRIERWIQENSRPVVMEEIVDGRRYGIFTLSDRAAAYSKNLGKWLHDHGDLYIIKWEWSEKYGEFFNSNAWGGISTMKIDEVHKPLIELP